MPQDSRSLAVDTADDVIRRSCSKSDLITRHKTSALMFAHYNVLHELGEGAFGKVELVRNSTTGHERVMKTVSIEGMPVEAVDLMKKEIAALQELDHPHIVRLYEYADIPDEQKLYLIMEKLPGGDGEALLKRRTISETLVARLITQVLSATAYCHARGIIHRDMKPENVMLTSKQGGDSTDCKVIDFGLAASFEHSRPRQLQEICGTPAYMAPEVVDESRLSGPKQDVWSIGVMAFKWLTRSLPFGEPTDYDDGMPGLFAAIKAYDGLDNDERWEDRSADSFDFVQTLMSLSLEDRPSAAEALQHMWIEDKKAKHHSALTREMLQSIDGYARSPLLTRACLLLIAARMDASQLDDIRHAFMQLDLDGSGDLSWDEVSDAADSASMWCSVDIDLKEAFDGADMDHSGILEYSEFVAACLFSQWSSYRGQELANYAFQAFDDDANGEVTREQVREFFKASSCGDDVLQCLPDNPFDAKEFYKCLRDGAEDDSDGDDIAFLASPRELEAKRRRPQGFFACCT